MRTKEDYAEIIRALERFNGKRMELTWTFTDGVIRRTRMQRKVEWDEAAGMYSRVADVAGPFDMQPSSGYYCNPVVPGMKVEVWDDGFREVWPTGSVEALVQP